MLVRQYLNRTLDVYRPVSTSDGMGGTTTSYANTSTVKAMVAQPGGTEKDVANQFGAYQRFRIYMLPSVDVRRGDELRGDSQVFRVVDVEKPSRHVYTKAISELVQAEGDA